MDKQLDTTIELSDEQLALRSLLDTEILLIGGGDTIVGRGRHTDTPFQPNEGSSGGAQFVEVDVDTETGVVRAIPPVPAGITRPVGARRTV